MRAAPTKHRKVERGKHLREEMDSCSGTDKSTGDRRETQPQRKCSRLGRWMAPPAQAIQWALAHARSRPGGVWPLRNWRKRFRKHFSRRSQNRREVFPHQRVALLTERGMGVPLLVMRSPGDPWPPLRSLQHPRRPPRNPLAVFHRQ